MLSSGPMQQVTELLAPIMPCVLGIAAWGATNYLVVASELGPRIAERELLPQCEAGVLAEHARLEDAFALERGKAAEIRSRIETEARRAFDHAMRDWEMKKRAFESSREMLGPLGDLFGQGFDLFDQAFNLQMPRLEDFLPQDTPPEAAPLQLADPGDVCGCKVEHALETMRVDITIYSASLRTVVPASLQNFPSYIDTVVPPQACGPVAIGS